MFYSVDTPAEATQIFEFQNDRGQPLTELERLKSYLMHQLYLHSGPNVDADLDIVQQAFGRIHRAAQCFEAEHTEPGSDAVLSYHCAAFLPWSDVGADQELFRQPKSLFRAILKGGIFTGTVPGWIKSAVGDIAVSFEAITTLYGERDRFDRLGGLFAIGRVAVFWPLLLKVWRLRAKDLNGFRETVRRMERLAWRLNLARLRADTLNSTLRRDAGFFSGDFELLASRLASYEEWYGIPERCAISLDQDNFYNMTRVCRYLLWRYELHLLSQPGKQERGPSWREAAGDETNMAVQLTLDHIQPQKSDPQVLDRLVRWDTANTNERLRPFKSPFRIGFSTGQPS